MRYLSDIDRKKLSKIVKKKIEKKLNSKTQNKSRSVVKSFDIKSSIIIETQELFVRVLWSEINKPWGYNRKRNTFYLFDNFKESFNQNYKKKLFNLLDLSKNNSLRYTDKDRKYPFKQEVFPDEINEGDWYSPPGKEIVYTNIKNEQNPYQINYFRKTKIPFFKGPKNEENFILKKKWDKIYAFGFIYGYIQTCQNFVKNEWIFKRKNNRSEDVKITFKNKSPAVEGSEGIEFEELYENYIKNNFKLNDKPDEILFNIQKRIHGTNLSTLLKIKKENYFTFRERSFKRTLEHHYEQVGTSEFLEGILRHKDLYLGSADSGRFYDTVLKTRFDERKNNITGDVYNYEQFLMYTMSLEYFYPLNFEKLGIDEKDIFLRFAINRGKDEFLDYAFAKIF